MQKLNNYVIVLIIANVTGRLYLDQVFPQSWNRVQRTEAHTKSQQAKDFILKQREIQSRCAAGEQQALSKDALTS